ncbi:MAG TPA: NAD(P)-dependent oxidoreductase [Amycolatopsis sp.]|nr:NAD(P)-dependent oxidoreductase [Amycolatopsis sp.]
MTGNAVRVAVLGLGAMGRPMARRLARDLPVTVFDPAFDPGSGSAAGFDPADVTAGRDVPGITVAATAAEAATGADVVLVAVRDSEQVHGALFGEQGAAAAMRPGAVVVLTSTVGPDAARATAARLAESDLAFVDAPVSGGPARAGSGDLLIVVGAGETELAAARPVLDRLGSTVTVVGPRPGDGQSLKAINQLLAGVHIAAAAEAVALARGVGLDPAVVIDSLSKGAAGSFMLADRGPRMIEAYGAGAQVRSRLDIFVKDMGIVTGIAKDAHVPLPLAAAAQQLYLLGERAGLGAADDSTVVTLLSPPHESAQDSAHDSARNSPAPPD